MSLENIIKSLENGICPLELNYKPCEGGENIDWNKVMYNLTYKQPEFFEDKFPVECKHIPGFDKVIDLIVEKNYENSPLKEILERQDKLIEMQENLNNIYEPTESDTDTS
jgi:hypothetical protein